MITLFFAGAEQSSHRKLLAAEGVRDVALSFVGLARKIAAPQEWSLAQHFPDQRVFVDSGAYSFNSAPTPPDPEDLLRRANQYTRFIADNIDAIEMASEFDALALGQDWILGERDAFYDDLGEKFLPVWHPETGIAELNRLCATYPRVGITADALGEHAIIPTVHAAITRHHVRVHGIGITQPELMASLRFDSVSSTSWTSPQRFGDTIIYAGGTLHRYPKRMKERARTRHRMDIINAGFDPALIEADDPTEVLRLSIWSWRQLVDTLSGKRSLLKLVTDTPKTPQASNAQTPTDHVDQPGEGAHNAIALRTEPPTLLPGLRTDTIEQTSTDPATGTITRRALPVLRLDAAGIRQCNACHVSATCPAYTPGASCAYLLPVELRTPEQRDDFEETVLELQARRALAGYHAEQAAGGYPDANISAEIDRYMRMSKQVRDRDAAGFSLTIQAKQSGRAEAGIISRLFGRDPAERALPGASAPIVDAQVVEDQ